MKNSLPLVRSLAQNKGVPPLNVAQLLVKCLENEGVRHVFGIPGEETLALNAALDDSSKIRFVLTRHEQGAAFMADVYGRLSSYPGVCLATLGPGATNLLTGVADAQLDRAPLVAITGQAGLERVHLESHQYIDIVGMFTPVTKWSTRVTVANTVPEVVRKAFRLPRCALVAAGRASATGRGSRQSEGARRRRRRDRDRLRPRRVGSGAVEPEARQGRYPRRLDTGRARRPLPAVCRSHRRATRIARGARRTSQAAR